MSDNGKTTGWFDEDDQLLREVCDMREIYERKRGLDRIRLVIECAALILSYLWFGWQGLVIVVLSFLARRVYVESNNWSSLLE